MLQRLTPVALVLFGFNASAAAQLPPNSLWHVVNSLCVPAIEAGGDPQPCLEVDLNRGFAMLAVDAGHLLLVPTRKISGVESPELLNDDAPNYWAFAWPFRQQIQDAVSPDLNRDDFAMAINAVEGRSQDQLHIHLGCVRPDVRAALQIYEPNIMSTWSKLPFAVIGQRYNIMRLRQDELGAFDPFKLVASGVPGAGADMGGQTIVVVGARFRDGSPGFYFLTSSTTPNGESLLDYQCKVSLKPG